MSSWQRSCVDRVCDRQCYFFSGPIWRNRAPRSTGESRSTGIAPAQKLSCFEIQCFHPTATKWTFKLSSETLQSQVNRIFQHVNNPFNPQLTQRHKHLLFMILTYTHMPYAHIHTDSSKTSTPSLLLVLWHLTWLMLCSGTGFVWSSGSHWIARREGR